MASHRQAPTRPSHVQRSGPKRSRTCSASEPPKSSVPRSKRSPGARWDRPVSEEGIDWIIRNRSRGRQAPPARDARRHGPGEGVAAVSDRLVPQGQSPANPGIREAQAELAEREDSNTPVFVTACGSATYETKPLRARFYGLHSVAAGCAGFRLSVRWRGHNLVTRLQPAVSHRKAPEASAVFPLLSA